MSVDDVVALLAPALGREKSEEVIITGAGALRHRLDRLTFEQAREILAKLGIEPGIVGVAARFALTRLVPSRRSSGKLKIAPVRSGSPQAPKSATEEPAAEKTIGHDDVAMLLAHSLGIEKAKEVVAAAVAELSISAERLVRSQAQSILDRVASTPGIVGVTARFAKARLILRFGEMD